MFGIAGIPERMSKRSVKEGKSVSQAKKSRVALNPPANFVEGSIIRLKLKAFVTYDDCEVFPGPGLNVVIGPNGTGKSSLVCAICLGLGGNTNLLGRAKEVGDYVKHGYKEGSVEIELFCYSGNVVIQRKLKQGTSSSKWTVNGRDVMQKEVLEVVKTLNIQISNLCQFLPQDKVVEFAKMSSIELLLATEKALNHEKDHLKLIQLQEQHKELMRRESSAQSEQDRLERQQELHAGDVRRYRERKRGLESIGTLKKKRAWVYYESLRVAYGRAKVALSEVTKQLQEVRGRNGPLQQEIADASAKVKNHKTTVTELNQVITRHRRNIDSKVTHLESLENDVDEPKKAFREAQFLENKRLREMKRFEKEVETLEAELDALPPTQNVQPQVNELTAKIRQCSSTVNGISTEREGLRQQSDDLKNSLRRCTSEMKRLEDSKQCREELLKRRAYDAYQAVQWLRSNQHRFKGTVVEPMLLEINMKDVSKAKHLEATVPFRDLTAFVFADTEDMHLFIAETRERQRWKVNTVQPPKAPLSTFQSRYSAADLRRHGFGVFLKDTFDAPDLVMRYLCESYKIQDIPIGNESTERNLSSVIENSGVSMFFTPRRRVQVNKSRYSGEKSSLISSVNSSNLLNIQVDTQRRDELRQQIDGLGAQLKRLSDRDQSLKKREEDLRKEESELKSERKALLDSKNAAQSIERNIASKKLKLEQLEKKKVNLEKEEATMKRSLEQLHRRRVAALRQIQAFSNELQQVIDDKFKASLQQIGAQANLSQLENSFQDSKDEIRALEALKDQAKLDSEDARKKAKDAIKRAQEESGARQITTELQRAFELFPETLEDIDAMIRQAQDAIDCIRNTDAQIVADYEKREEDIAAVKARAEKIGKDLEEDQAKIESLKNEWLGPLKDMIKRIGERFSNFFEKIGCVGEVMLQEADDFTKYSVELKVKYRKTEDLQLLTAHHQSGGERSVATMLYLMALQGDTACPFRVVDEINQGMDPANEHAVFELVVDTVSAMGRSQYFLITPKLLPNLRFKADMSILIVYNGSHMLPHTRWDSGKAIQTAKNFAEDE